MEKGGHQVNSNFKILFKSRPIEVKKAISSKSIASLMLPLISMSFMSKPALMKSNGILEEFHERF